MKSKILFLLIIAQFSLLGQNAGNKNELSKIKKQFEKHDLAGFTEEIKNILSATNHDNINQQLILFDNIYNTVEGEFTEGCDTILEVLRFNYLADLLKFLTNKKESKFEAGYINLMVIKIKYSIQKKVSTSDFEGSINRILPQLNAKEKEYVMNLKEKILQLSN